MTHLNKLVALLDELGVALAVHLLVLEGYVDDVDGLVRVVLSNGRSLGSGGAGGTGGGAGEGVRLSPMSRELHLMRMGGNTV